MASAYNSGARVPCWSGAGGELVRSACLAQDDDLVAERDLAVAQDVGAEARPVDERGQDRLAEQALEVGARLGELDAHAADVADPELVPDQVAQVQAPDCQVAPRVARLDVQPGVLGIRLLDRLGRDERDPAAARAVGPLADAGVVAIALEPAAG